MSLLRAPHYDTEIKFEQIIEETFFQTFYEEVSENVRSEGPNAEYFTRKFANGKSSTDSGFDTTDSTKCKKF